MLCVQEYAAALQQVLSADYVASSHHARWDGCFVAAIGACDRSLGGVISPAAAEVPASPSNTFEFVFRTACCETLLDKDGLFHQ